MDPNDAYDQGYEAGKAMERRISEARIAALEAEAAFLRPFYEEYQAEWRRQRQRMAEQARQPSDLPF